MINNIIVVFITAILTIPVWIRVVSLGSWHPKIKKTLIIGLVMIAISVVIYGFLQPLVNPTPAKFVLSVLSFLLYISAVLFSAYKHWPNKTHFYNNKK
jgi:hypothetical protein